MRMLIDPINHTVEVEGVDISTSIRRATVDLQAGRPVEVFLELGAGKLAPDVLEVEGVVHLVREGGDVLAWLDTVDADALETSVLASADLSESTGEAFLTQLKKLAANG
jgi:hypothetical protein